MRADLLLRLADLLEADAANPKGVQFDLRTWGDSHGGALEVRCGTEACAIGLACLSREFEAEGLTYRLVDDTGIEPLYNGKFGFEAAQFLFEISTEDSLNLFSSVRYPVNIGAEAELAVARRIRNLVAETLNRGR